QFLGEGRLDRELRSAGRQLGESRVDVGQRCLDHGDHRRSLGLGRNRGGGLQGYDGARQFHVLGLGRDTAGAVRGSQSLNLCGGAVDQVEVVEEGILDDGGDLIAQGGGVRGQRLAARGIQRGISCGKRLLLLLDL